MAVLADALIALGRLDQAVAVARSGVRLCVEHDESWYRATLLVASGTALWLQGSYYDATTVGRESLALARSLDHAYGELCALELVAWVAASTGDRDRAAVLFGALGPLWHSIGAPSGGSGGVRAHHEPSRRALVEAMGERAYDRAARRGAQLSLEEAVAFYLGDSVRPAKRRRQQGMVPALTRRELEVADLVARGMTNQQIAQALVISVRTAEGHVQRILDKLGSSSRARIASWLAERGPAAGPVSGRDER
jgi:non-specific serine/threonine protein kinase